MYVEMLPTSQKLSLQPALNASLVTVFSTLYVSSIAVVAEVFPWVVDIVHSHISDWI